MPTWKIELKPAARKQYLKLDKKTRRRIKAVLLELEAQDAPLSRHDVRPLTGKLKGDYRLRIGSWRILFTPDHELGFLRIYAILPRGDAYKS